MGRDEDPVASHLDVKTKIPGCCPVPTRIFDASKEQNVSDSQNGSFLVKRDVAVMVFGRA